jgi:hypothetical protein
MYFHNRAAVATRLALFWLTLPAITLCAGCKNPCELVERQNYQLEVALRDARAEVARTRAYNGMLEQQLSTVQPVPPPPPPAPPGVRISSYPVKSMTLTKQTGGINTDGHTGDDAVQLVLEPKDAEGHSAKTPGSLFVELSEIASDGSTKAISNWLVPPEQMASRWRSGLFTNGYFVVLPWKTWPQSDKLKVAIKFAAPDGRTFEDQKDITIKPRPLAQRTILPADPTDGPRLDAPQVPTHRLELPPVEGPSLDTNRTQAPAPRLSDASVHAISLDLGAPR